MTQFCTLRIGQRSAFVGKFLILSLVFSSSLVNANDVGSDVDREQDQDPTIIQRPGSPAKNTEVDLSIDLRINVGVLPILFFQGVKYNLE